MEFPQFPGDLDWANFFMENWPWAVLGIGIACVLFWAARRFFFKKDARPLEKEPPPAPAQEREDRDREKEETGAAETRRPPEKAAPPAFAAGVKEGLLKTRRAAAERIEGLFFKKKALDDDLFEELEELLIGMDMGVKTALDLISAISGGSVGVSSPDALKQALKEEIRKIMSGCPGAAASPDPGDAPRVIMVAGVNGTGKTTTVGKLAARHGAMGKKVLIGAADTFRAAASDQLGIWAERAGAGIVKARPMSDPAAVAYDSAQAALSRGADILIVDTAGRLHTQANLMEELKKVERAIGKKIPGAPHETLLVLDATTGQNALSQARMFDEVLEGISGIVLTKLDGTAKGGIAAAICADLKIPLKYIGVGEKIGDLETFDAVKFADSLF
ncbi:Signal recognition particle receptor FtsY [Candidatus Desulfarcum epimagneticum]|uniref:Signal recognition particle receptor FtsY n=1 Tax=uncultured Desulfobacteraceae bacterium TaxID=218296 RepID=A0A484HEP7_9BACT|nr:Signal recognition particle receptor FtsY [uncultured Desulfobacteraceae bacterium]